MRTQTLRDADDDNTEQITSVDMCYRISDNDSNRKKRESTNSNINKQEADIKKNVLATFLLATYAATISFMHAIPHRRTFVRLLIFHRNSK
jgi:hypothetical protein